MSIYYVHKVLHLIETDAQFLESFRRDVDAALVGFRLDPSEAAAIRTGDVGTLYRKGVHPFLLHTLARHGLCGLDKDSYMVQVRAASKI